jgi:uncharacterized membrane protein (DUF2068 family)
LFRATFGRADRSLDCFNAQNFSAECYNKPRFGKNNFRLNILEKIHPGKTGIRAIAIYEVVKGALVLAAGIGLLSLINKDLQDFAENLVETLHLNPANQYVAKAVETVGNLTTTNIKFIAIFSVVYAAVRFAEAYGLWKLQAWAEWFAIISGALYIPVEIYELIHKPTFTRAAILVVNIIVVIYLYSFRKAQNREKDIHASEIQSNEAQQKIIS